MRIKDLVRQLLPMTPLTGDLGQADLAVLERYAGPRSVTSWRTTNRGLGWRSRLGRCWSQYTGPRPQGLRGVPGRRSPLMRQAMTLTFSAWGPFWPCVMSNSTFCPSSRLR